MRKIKEWLLGEHVCTTVDILEGRPLGACTEFAVPEVHSGIFIDEGCRINRAYWDWKRTGAVSEFEEVGHAVFKILKDNLIWRQDCSHILAANYTLFIYVHVPVGTANSRLRLYEYLETPVKIGGQMMILSPREHMLACLLYTSPSPRD